ncbi:MAG: hypothetical protein ACJAVR_001692 [Paracoccaceae bacterium]
MTGAALSPLFDTNGAVRQDWIAAPQQKRVGNQSGAASQVTCHTISPGGGQVFETKDSQRSRNMLVFIKEILTLKAHPSVVSRGKV